MGLSLSAKSGGRGGKLVFTLFGLAFAVFGLFFVRQEWQALREVRAMRQWLETPCRIVSCSMDDTGDQYEVTVSFTYEADGQACTSGRYGRNAVFTAAGIGEADRLHQSLPPGTETVCHVNPLNPADAVLRRPAVKGAYVSACFTLLFPAFGMLFAALPWLSGTGRKAERGPMSGNGRSAKLFLTAFGAIFALAGSLMLKPFLIVPLQKTHAAEAWEPVPATVVSSRVKSHDSDDGTTYSVYIAYRYEVDGTAYLNDRYSFMGGSSSGYDSKAATVAQYPQGRRFDVYVNPADPSEAVIRRGYSLQLLFGLIPLVFLLIGIGIMSGAWRKRRIDRSQAKKQIVTLKGSSPAAKAAGITAFAVFWNGIVFFLCKSDAPLLFPVIFGFFGLIMAVAAIHALLALANPRPTVEITPGDIRPGTSVAMRWRTRGRIDRIETLTVTLQCLQLKTETTGSGKSRSTRTVTVPLLEQRLLETAGQSEIAQGTLQFTIPENGKPTDALSNPQIRWQLVFHGRIARWPDMKEQLPLAVFSPDLMTV